MGPSDPSFLGSLLFPIVVLVELVFISMDETQSTVEIDVVDESSESSSSSEEKIAWVSFQTLHVMLTDPVIFKNIRGYMFDDNKYRSKDRKCWKLDFYN